MNLKSFGNATQESILEFERFIGFLLPEDYKNFLQTYNGGKPKVKYSTFFVKELNQEIPLHILYGIGVKRKSYDLKDCYEYFEAELVPNSLVIGDDTGSGLIMLISDNEKSGVYYWDQSLHFPQSTEDENTYKIASSFKSFANRLSNP